MTARLREAREFLLAHREEYATPTAISAGPASTASTGRWTGSTPRRGQMTGSRCGSWARTDASAALVRRALRAVEPGGQLAASPGVRRGDRMLVMLGNGRPLWELLLAAMKLGRRGHAGHAAARAAPTWPTASSAARPATSSTDAAGAAKFGDVAGDYTRIAVGDDRSPAWLRFERRRPGAAAFVPDGETAGDRPAAAVLHVRHHRAAQAGRAHATSLSGGAPVDDVLDRAPARATCT